MSSLLYLLDYFEILQGIYFFLYRLSIIVTIPLLMSALSHTDRVHMRERARRFGASAVEYVSSLSKPYGNLLNISNLLRLHIWRPVCILTDIIGGFNEGVENLEPTMMIAEPYNSYSRDLKNSIDYTHLLQLQLQPQSQQTNNEVPSQIKIDEKLHLKEQSDIISQLNTRSTRRSGLRRNRQNKLNDISQESKWADRSLCTIDTKSHRSIATEIIGKHAVDVQSDSVSNDESISISTKGSDDIYSNSSNDSDNLDDSDNLNDANDSNNSDNTSDNIIIDKTTDAISDIVIDNTDETNNDNNEKGSSLVNHKQIRSGFRVRRIAPKAKSAGRIRLARRT